MPIRCPEDGIVNPAKSSVSSIASDELCSVAEVVKCSKEIGDILDEFFDATGAGLSEKVSSIEHALPQGMKTKLRAVAVIYNKVTCERQFGPSEIAAYVAQCRDTLTDLRALTGEGSGRWLVELMFIGISGFAGFSVGMRNFNFGGGIALALVCVSGCALVLWHKRLYKTIIGKKHKK